MIGRCWSPLDEVEIRLIERMRAFTYEPARAFSLNFFQSILREIARGVLRSLRDRGIVEHVKGLWSADGEPRGAGYALTDKAIRTLREREKGEADADAPAG